MKDQISDGGVGSYLFVEDMCVQSLFAFPLFVPLPSTNLLSKKKKKTFQLDPTTCANFQLLIREPELRECPGRHHQTGASVRFKLFSF